jgi:hypothetical protein
LLAEETADIADGFEEDIEGSGPDAFEMRLEFGEYEPLAVIVLSSWFGFAIVGGHSAQRSGNGDFMFTIAGNR